ncbi:MAG: hypothetical protein H6912_10675 [Kordiimonadaceae bacterium]|nr:hypothetical protein [Kordiimonadaceae bacterium]
MKLPNNTCSNLKTNGGCAIYQTRPTVCQNWFCAWRNLPELDENWRPDKSGVLVEFTEENFPPPFSGRVGFRFTILDKKKLKNNNKLAKFLIKQINNGVPCLLTFGLEKNTEPATAFLNFALNNAIKTNDINNILHELNKAIEACEKMPKIKVAIENGQLIYEN